MPQVIPFALSAVATAAGATAIVSSAILIVGTLALSSYQRSKAERAERARFDAAQVDRLANYPATGGPRELVMGRMIKGGPVPFRSSVGALKERFVFIVVLAGHEIDGVEQIFLNDQPVTLDGAGNVTSAPYGRIVTATVPSGPGLGPGQTLSGPVTVLEHVPLDGSLSVVRTKPSAGGELDVQSVPFTLSGTLLTVPDFDFSWTHYVTYQHQFLDTKVNIAVHLGGPGQTADARLQELLPGVWTPQHVGTGIAYLRVELYFDETIFPSGIPTVTAQLRGAKLYDPRTGLTIFSESPPLMMRHVMVHPAFGKRASMTAEEDARIAAEANACAVGISYTGSDFVPMFRAAIVLEEGTPARDALNDLAQAMGGEWAYAQGQFFLRAGVYRAPVITLTEDDLAVVQRDNDGGVTQRQISISPHRERNDKVNIVLPTIWDAAAGYQRVPINPLRADALVAVDGCELALPVTMSAVFYAPQAYHIAGVILRDGRDPLTVTAPFKLSAYPVQLLDGVVLQWPHYGWTKEFRVLGHRVMPEGYIELTLKETSAAIFQYGAGFIPRGYASNSNLPRPWDITPPTITAIESGEDQLVVQTDGTIVNGVCVMWAAMQDASIVQSGSIELQYRKATDGVWHSIVVPGVDTQATFFGVEDRAIIFVRARSMSSIAVSDWGLQVQHQVVGKTAPPPDIEDLSISGTVLSWSLPRRVPDLAGFVFRFHYGNNLDWNSAVPLHSGIVTESPYDLVTRPNGVVTIMAKAVDTTGNQSRASANIVMNIGDPNIANVIEQWDFGATGWPFTAGEQSGWTLVGGLPTADALDSFYGTDEQSFYGDANESFYSAGDFAQMVYVTEEISVNTALAGSIMTLAIDADGKDLRIEYRLMGPGSFYGPDNASFYPADDDTPLYGPPGGWQPWPGQVVASNDVYQFRVTIGAGATQGVLNAMVLTVDAPDMREALADVPITAGGTLIPYAKNFTEIKAVLVGALQANGSGAIRHEIDKTVQLAPVIHAFNLAGVGVSGATADLEIIGY